MGIAQEVELYLSEPNPSNIAPLSATDASFTNQTPLPRRLNYRWWLVVTIYTVGLLIGQAGATLLGRFYFNNGGKSKWLATFVQSAGFPILIPFLLFFSPSSISNPSNNTKTTSLSIPFLTLIYLMLGLLVSGDNLMYSYGLLYLPVSTYSLLCATQLAFNAVFSYFLNSLKFTSFILNSIVLITISAIILAIHSESNTPSTAVSTGKYIIGFLCTIVASALYSLLLSLTQIFFEKVVKRNTIWVILEMQIYPAMVATCVCVVGLFASGDWKTLKGEMEEFKSGKVSYVMTLVWTAVLWLVFSVSCLGLIYEASSLLSNVISTVGLPIIPILAVVFFHDNMDGMKIVAMVLAIWGFVSYIYQHYLDDAKSHSTTTNASESSA